MITLKALVDYTDTLLSVEKFSDYCPNGLQVEGRAEIAARMNCSARTRNPSSFG